MILIKDKFNLKWLISILIFLSLSLRIFADFEFKNYFVIESGILIIFLLVGMLLSIRVGHIRKVSIIAFVFVSYSIVVPAISSNIYYDQPILYSVLANRVYIFSFGIFLTIFNFIDFNKINLKFIFEFLCVFYLALWYFLTAYLEPANYIETNLVDFRNVTSEYRFRFDSIPIALASIYSFYNILTFNGFKKNSYSKLYYIGILLFSLFYIVFIHQSRTILLVLLLSLFVVYITSSSVYKTKKMVSICILLWLVFIIYYLSNIVPIFGKVNYIDNFLQAVMVLVDPSSVDDYSALSRLVQYELISDDIANNTFFGTGILSNQFNGGYEYYYGWYFPTDLGLIGYIHTNGVIGFILWCVFVFSSYYRIIIKNRFSKMNCLFNGVVFFVVFVSIINAKFMYNFAFLFIVFNVFSEVIITDGRRK
jgi:hypothetical protein